jgi:uncharacterized protein YodC (DUF2158 family)
MKVGEVVQLKSGGPEMVVNNDMERGYVVCVWFGEDGHIHNATINSEALKTVDEGARAAK